MRILLDENIPVQLRNAFHRHVVASVNDAHVGWKNIKNGRLLAEMEGRFDLLITADKNIYAQQTLSDRPISILVLPTNTRKDVLLLSERITEVVDGMGVGEYAVLEKTVRLSGNRSAAAIGNDLRDHHHPRQHQFRDQIAKPDGTWLG